MRTGRVPLAVPAALAALALAATAAACSGGGTAADPDFTAAPGFDPDCIAVDMAVSPEKLTLLTDLAETFNGSGAKVGDRCVSVRVTRKSSGAAAQLLQQGWPNPENNGPQPVIWSPAASGWAAIVNERVGRTLAPAGRPFMQTPLVIAMPAPMAEALGYPETPIGFADIVALANDPEGWAKYGHPEWGQFKLGKTNPNFSTSGLNFTVAEYYAATGKTSGLTVEDLARPEVADFAQSVENAVVHYGDITLTFLNNWFRADARGTALTYTSAVAVEEKSIIDYNSGNPDGELVTGRDPPPAQGPARRHLPAGGNALLGQPVPGARRRVGDARAEAGGRAVRGVRAAAREPGPGPGVRLPARQHLGRGRRADRGRQRRRSRPAPERARRARARRPGEGARRLGAAAQGGAGAAA